MINNRIKHFLDDDSWPERYSAKDLQGFDEMMCPASSSNIAELKAFIDSIEDKVCEVMGEAFCDGKLFGVNIMVNPETREFRIWRCDDKCD